MSQGEERAATLARDKLLRKWAEKRPYPFTAPLIVVSRGRGMWGVQAAEPAAWGSYHFAGWYPLLP